MTSVHSVYDAFLSKMLEDEWLNWTDEEIQQDWRALLNAAIPRFKFPRVDIDIDEEEQAFIGDLDIDEIEILACFMKCEWLNREILTWENIKPLYVERDFSQANLIDKMVKLLANEKKNAASLERIYYRSRKRKPFDYTRLAGE
jgi:hypothetical protein